MPAHVFWLQHFDLIHYYFGVLLVSVLVHHTIFSRYVFGILDPLFYLEVSFIFTVTTAWYVFFVGYIQPEIFYTLLACQALAYFGFVLVAPTKAQVVANCRSRAEAAPHWTPFSLLLLKIGALCFLAATLFDYSLAGIPILRRFRQGAFVGSGGLGIITRFEDIAFILIALLAAGGLVYKSRGKRAEGVIWLIVALAFAVLSGAKAGALVVAQVIYVIYVLRAGAKTRFITMKSFAIIAAVTLGALIVVAAGRSVTGDVFKDFGDNRFVLAFITLAYRLINFGDIFINSYPYNIIGNISDREGWISLFAGVLSTFRLIDPASVPLPLGYALLHYIFPGIGVVGGPNSYFSVFSYHYWGGLGSIVFSLAVGLFFGLGRRLVLLNGAAIFESSSPTRSLSSAFLFLAGWILMDSTTDPPYIVSRLVSVFLLLCFIAPFALAGWYAGYRKKPARSVESA